MKLSDVSPRSLFVVLWSIRFPRDTTSFPFEMEKSPTVYHTSNSFQSAVQYIDYNLSSVQIHKEMRANKIS